MWNTDAEGLKGYFSDTSIYQLQQIINGETAGDDSLQLLAIMQNEMSRGVLFWEISPNGANHIIIESNKCFLFSRFGYIVLVDSYLFLEGELVIKNIQWIEADRLVLFDLFYIVHDETQKIVCYYGEQDSFVFKSFIIKNENETSVISEECDEQIFDSEW